MATETHPDLIECRLIITRRKASEILFSTVHSGSSLPQVRVSRGVRFTEQLLARVRQDYLLETYCLSNQNPRSPDLLSYAVLEARRQNDEAPSATTWISSQEAASLEALSAPDRSAISSSLEDLDRYTTEPETGPFARPGWIDELFRWVGEVTQPLGLRTTGRFEQLNAGPTFSLMRIETSGGALWFKATGEPNARELPISVSLDRLFPGYVPRVLGVHPTWNGWLSEETTGRTLDESSDSQAWAEAARTLAELQIASVPKTAMLIEAGCRNLTLRELSQRIDPFVHRMCDLMALQKKEPPQVLKHAELGSLGDCLKDALSRLEQHRMPSTLGHLDLNPGNIVVSPSGCRFLDWAEAFVTHPLFTFEYLSEHLRRRFPEAHVAREALAPAYLKPWESFFSREALAEAMVTSPLLAVFTYAVADKRWTSPEALDNPAVAGYFRSLTRSAYRQATRSAARREPCRA